MKAGVKKAPKSLKSLDFFNIVALPEVFHRRDRRRLSFIPQIALPKSVLMISFTPESFIMQGFIGRVPRTSSHTRDTSHTLTTVALNGTWAGH